MPLKDPIARKLYKAKFYKKNADRIKAAVKKNARKKWGAIKARMQMYREQNRASANRREKIRHAKLRAEIIFAFGGKCACCGESEPHFMELDHKNNDGHAHRKTIGTSSPKIYKDVKKRGFPKDEFQLLCSNCNRGRSRNGGICPHENIRKTI